MSFKQIITVGFTALGLASAAHADVVTLTFEGVGNLARVESFYNGGTDSAGHSGVNYGVSFSPSALGVIDRDAGGSGNLANLPSGVTAMIFGTGSSSAVMNVAAGFSGGFSFFYSSVNFSGSVKVWSGLDGTGTLLGTIDLALLSDPCTADPANAYCVWSARGLVLNETAHSIDFSGTQNAIAFDNITIGSAVPGGGGGGNAPEPGSLALVGAALLGLAVARRRAV